MDFWAILPAVIFIIFILALKEILESYQSSNKANYQYKRRKHLMTQHELAFYKKLLAETKDKSETIFSKVRVADILDTNETGRRRNPAFNRIKSKHIDFIVCDSNTGEILRCIELNDSSHNKPKRRERDKFLEEIFTQAGVLLEFRK